MANIAKFVVFLCKETSGQSPDLEEMQELKISLGDGVM
jgi:hypothetical protein